MEASQVTQQLESLKNDWQLDDSGTVILFDFKFKDYYQTISFVNSLAWIANQQDHHPDLEVGYNHCLVKYSTHSLNALSDKDFTCAHLIEALFNQAAD